MQIPIKRVCAECTIVSAGYTPVQSFFSRFTDPLNGAAVLWNQRVECEAVRYFVPFLVFGMTW